VSLLSKSLAKALKPFLDDDALRLWLVGRSEGCETPASGRRVAAEVGRISSTRKSCQPAACQSCTSAEPLRTGSVSGFNRHGNVILHQKATAAQELLSDAGLAIRCAEK
jgi:hypothetical protein